VTYTELFTRVKSYLQSDFPTVVWTDVAGTGPIVDDGTAQIDALIKQAEERIYNSVQIPPLRKNVMGVLSTNNPYLSCPSDFMSSFSLAVIDTSNNYEYLLNKDVNFLRSAYPNPTETGLPKYYSLFGPTVVSTTITDELSFIVAPTPDAAYAAELHYYAYPESIIDAADGKTWLSNNYSPALLYGTLVEGYIFLKGEADLMAAYEKKFQDALGQLNRLGSGLERGDAYRDGQYKMKVGP